MDDFTLAYSKENDTVTVTDNTSGAVSTYVNSAPKTDPVATVVVTTEAGVVTTLTAPAPEAAAA